MSGPKKCSLSPGQRLRVSRVSLPALGCISPRRCPEKSVRPLTDRALASPSNALARHPWHRFSSTPIPAISWARFSAALFAWCPNQARAVWNRDIRPIVVWGVLLLALFGDGALVEVATGKSASTRETLIRVSTERDGPGTRLLVENLQAAEVTVTFEMDLVNLSASVSFPFTTTLTGLQRVELFRLTPKDAALGWSWTYTYYSTFGSTAAKHDDGCIYSLPYSPGQAYRVSQAYNGEYSHFGADQFAVDWRMPIGTPVHAARGGVVVGVKNDSSVGGDDSKFDWDANYVLIQHPDGTLGQYVHLEKGGCRVKVGEQVEVGDLLGLSGNTGHSTGPHLHFSVFKAKDGKHRQTIPVRYRTTENVAVVPAEGQSYRAVYQSNLASAAGEKSRPAQHSERAVGTSAPSQLDSVALRVTEGLGH